MLGILLGQFNESTIKQATTTSARRFECTWVDANDRL
jgi:hypothetical protein